MTTGLWRRVTEESFIPVAMSIMLVAAFSCAGSSEPSDEQVKQIWLADRGKSLTETQPGELVSFKKANGVAGEDSGVKLYEFQYEATLRCKQDWSFGYGTTEPYVCKAGETVIDRGAYTFRLTENGWEQIPE